MGLIQDKTAGLVSTRTAVLATLLAAPIIVYSVAGSLAVWQLGWMRWLWWLAPIIWGITWLISRIWPAPKLAGPDLTQPQYWTPRDEEAALIIRRFQEQVEQYTTDQLTDPQFYLNQAQTIAHELARHYRPGTQDPIADRTLPEIFAACRLVADDLEKLLLTSVPGSRMLTVNQWRKLSETPRFVRQATKAFWATKILLNPFNLAQWGTSKVTNDNVTSDLQSEFLSALYVRFVKQLGYYLIEMNSGRLRAGADAYRCAFGRLRKAEATDGCSAENTLLDIQDASNRSLDLPGHDGAVEENPQSLSPSQAKTEVNSLPVKIAFMGESGVGKSTLIRTLLEGPADRGTQRPNSGTLPTRSIEVFEVSDSRSGLEIQLLDTPGYEANATGKKLIKPIQFAVESVQAIFLVLAADAENWTADQELLKRIEDSFQTRKNLRPPKVIAVFSYSAGTVANPVEPAESRQITDSQVPRIGAVIARAKSQFKDLIDDFVPCPLTGQDDPAQFRVAFWGVLSRHLDAAHSSAVLAAFEASLAKGKYRILLSQAKTSGKKLLESWFKKS
jgi:hypothetical protein